jgi:hypothetical protein
MFWLHLPQRALPKRLYDERYHRASPNTHRNITSIQLHYYFESYQQEEKEENTIKTMDHSHHAAMDHSHMDHGDMGGGHDMPMCSMNVSWAIPSRTSLQ